MERRGFLAAVAALPALLFGGKVDAGADTDLWIERGPKIKGMGIDFWVKPKGPAYVPPPYDGDIKRLRRLIEPHVARLFPTPHDCEGFWSIIRDYLNWQTLRVYFDISRRDRSTCGVKTAVFSLAELAQSNWSATGVRKRLENTASRPWRNVGLYEVMPPEAVPDDGAFSRK